MRTHEDHVASGVPVGDPPGRARRLGVRLIVAALAVVALGMAVLVGLAAAPGASPEPASRASAGVAATEPPQPSSTMEPSVRPTAETSVPTAPSATAPPAGPSDLAGAPWYVMQFFSGCPANVVPEPVWQCSGGGPARDGFLELRAGTLDGRAPAHVVKPLPASARLWSGLGSQASASGPFGSTVLYWFWDGRRSELHAVDAVTGADRRLLRIGDIVYGAVLDPATSAVYFGELDAATRRDRGVWRLAAGSGAGPARVVAPQRHRYTGSEQWQRRLYLTPDGARLVVMDCEDLACGVSVRRAADGVQVASAQVRGRGGATGATDADLVGVECGSGCSVGAVDLGTGRVRTVTEEPCAASGYGVLGAASDGRPLVVAHAAAGPACGPEGTVVTVDLASGLVRTAWSGAPADPAGATLRLAIQAEGVVGYSAPAGWALLAPDGLLARSAASGALRPALVRLVDGTLVPVPFAPPFTTSQ